MLNRFAAITGRDRWCVPAALAALTGWSTDVFRAMVVGDGYASRDQWRGVNWKDIEGILDTLGITGVIREHWRDRFGKPTLNQWFRSHASGTYLVDAGCHMILIRDGYVVDNGTYASKQGVPFEELHKGKRARMRWSMQLDDEAPHERQEQYKPPAWALVAGKELAEARIRNRDATISPARIDAIRYEERQKEAAAKRQAEERNRKQQEERNRKERNGKTCSRCEAKATRKGMCTSCWRKAFRNWEFGGTECKVEGCDRIAEAKGCCRNHWRKHGND